MDYIYYTFILPISILLGGGLVLLMLVMWILFKVGGHRGLIRIRFARIFRGIYVKLSVHSTHGKTSQLPKMVYKCAVLARIIDTDANTV